MYLSHHPSIVANPCRLFPPPSNGCDGGLKVISLKSAALTSPQYPSLYPSDATCLYKIDMSGKYVQMIDAVLARCVYEVIEYMYY